MKKIISILIITAVLLCGCNNTKEKNSLENIEYAKNITRIVFSNGSSIAFFDNYDEMPPYFLQAYFMTVLHKYDFFNEVINKRPIPMVDSKQIKTILKEEFEQESLPFVIANEDELLVETAGAQGFGEGPYIVDTQEKDNKIYVDFIIYDQFNRFDMSANYNADGTEKENKMEQFKKIGYKIRFTFKARKGKTPMLISSENITAKADISEFDFSE